VKLLTGDILFVCNNSAVSKLIKLVTFGEVSHVGILYNEDTIFETDGKYGKAEFHPLIRYKGKNIEIYRYNTLNPSQIAYLQALCKEYEGRPYSFLDVALKGLLFWLHPNIRRKITSKLGNKYFLICNELVMLIMSKVTKHPVFRYVEGSNPAELRQYVRRDKDFQRIL